MQAQQAVKDAGSMRQQARQLANMARPAPATRAVWAALRAGEAV